MGSGIAKSDFQTLNKVLRDNFVRDKGKYA